MNNYEIDFKNCIKKLRREMQRIPDFINTTSMIHYGIWVTLCNCNDIILKLASSKCLSDNAIIREVEKYERHIDKISKEMGDDEWKLVEYITDIEEMVSMELLENEIYEGMENIKKFHNFYLKHITQK